MKTRTKAGVGPELKMVDVGAKTPTRRRAVARGALRTGEKALRLLRLNLLPKGTALPLAEAAGIMAAKNAASTIPLCHPLPIEQVSVSFEFDDDLPGIWAVCSATAFAKTGVEMEALSGVAGALLALYDCVKAVEPALTIERIRLETKEGGASGFWTHPESRKSVHATHANECSTKIFHHPRLGCAAVVTVSDRCAAGRAADESGPLLAEGLKNMGFAVSKPVVIADDRKTIEKTISRLSEKSDIVALTGGTGLSPRDVTPEAVRSVCDREIPGFGEALRQASITKLSALSRGLAAQRGRAIVVALPGSPKAVREGLGVLAELLPHAVHIARGGNHGSS